METKVAVLGPEGTFTEKAAKEYLQKRQLQGAINYYPTLRKTMAAIGDSCQYGVIPIENTLDGFVQIILDLLMNSDLTIIHEYILPIQFKFIANTDQLTEIKRIYAQFKSRNQCLDFLERFSDSDIITTASNSESYQLLVEAGEPAGAIIPIHMAQRPDLFCMRDVADSRENETRFIIVAKQAEKRKTENQHWKTLIVVRDDQDRTGLLVDILNVFAREQINLKSIFSRPTKKGLGNYNFFIDIEGCYQKDEKVKRAVESLCQIYNIKILGSYYRIG